jgi:hypothetical protein
MSEKRTSTEAHCELGLYEIRIKAHLDDRWAAWFEGLNIKLEDNGNTLLTGTMVDQAALHGILKKVRDIGRPLLSVTYVEPGQTDVSDVKKTEKNHKTRKDNNIIQKKEKKMNINKTTTKMNTL